MGKQLIQYMDSSYVKGEEAGAYQFTTTQLCIAGGFSALPTTVVMAPSERLKCLLQIDSNTGGKAKYNGLADCAKKVYAEGGVRSVFKGTGATLLRDVPGSIAW